MVATKTHAQYKQQFELKGFKRLKLISKYVNARTVIEVNCKKHGLFRRLPKSILHYGCPKCFKENYVDPKSIDEITFVERMKKFNIDLIGRYLGWGIIHIFRCNIHNHTWKIKPSSLLTSYKRRGCKYCGIESSKILQTKTLSSAKTKISTLFPHITIHRFGSRNNLSKFSCKLCKTSWERTFGNQVKSSGCPKCDFVARGAKKITHSEYLQRLKDIGMEYLKPLAEYGTGNGRLPHECLKCGFIWKNALTNSILANCGCPNCSSLKKKMYLLNGNFVRVEGSEPHALDILIKRYSPKNIEVYSEGRVPLIKYRYNGAIKMHRPDIFLPTTNTLVEVKCPQTMGIVKHGVFNSSSSALFESLKRKRKAATTLGFNYRVMLIHNRLEIQLPAVWFNLDHSTIKKWWSLHV